MAGIGGVFGENSVARQMLIWGVLQGVITSALQPGFNEITQLTYDVAPNVPITPGEAVAEVARGYAARDDGAAEAKKSGLDGGRFDRLVDMTQVAPSVSDAIQAFRRKLIESGSGDPREASLTGAMAAAGLRENWRPIIEKLAVQLPSWQEALNALLEGQLDRATALDWYTRAGGDPDAFQWLFDTQGAAPTPVEALELVNRGIISLSGVGPDSTSYEQAFLEGPWRNKWLKPFEALREYLPPPRTVTAMYKEGSLSQDEAIDLLTKSGLSADLAAKYVSSGTAQATQASRDLTQSAVIDLFQTHIIAESDAASMLEALGYSAQSADYLIKLSELRVAVSQVNNAITRVRTLFIDHKIDAAVAESVLRALAVPNENITAVLTTWKLEAAVNVARLTESQVGQAFDNKIITQDEAQAQLEGLGYSPLDAWTLLSIRNKGPLPGKPAPGPAPVIASTT